MVEPTGAFLVVLLLGFGLPLWLMVFIATYMGFPKMEKWKRILMSIENATALALFVLAVTLISLVLLGYKLV